MRMRLASMVIGILLASWAGGHQDSVVQPTGQALFVRHCASCHGLSGEGNGPLAASLRRSPTDLTTIAKRRGGRFDEADVMAVIDGRRSIAEHGPREMPVWGAVFDESYKRERYESASRASAPRDHRDLPPPDAAKPPAPREAEDRAAADVPGARRARGPKRENAASAPRSARVASSDGARPDRVIPGLFFASGAVPRKMLAMSLQKATGLPWPSRNDRVDAKESKADSEATKQGSTSRLVASSTYTSSVHRKPRSAGEEFLSSRGTRLPVLELPWTWFTDPSAGKGHEERRSRW